MFFPPPSDASETSDREVDERTAPTETLSRTLLILGLIVIPVFVFVLLVYAELDLGRASRTLAGICVGGFGLALVISAERHRYRQTENTSPGAPWAPQSPLKGDPDLRAAKAPTPTFSMARAEPALADTSLTEKPVEAWIAQLQSPDVAARCEAALALADIGLEKQEIMNALVNALLDSDKAVVIAASIAIGFTKISPQARRNLRVSLQHSDEAVRLGAVKLLRWAANG